MIPRFNEDWYYDGNAAPLLGVRHCRVRLIGHAEDGLLRGKSREREFPDRLEIGSAVTRELVGGEDHALKQQASRGGLTPPPTCHTSARWLSPNGGCGRSATKGVSHDYSSQLAYRRSRCVDLCAGYCSSRKPHGDPGCAGSTRLLWLVRSAIVRSATNRLPLNCGVAP